MNLSSAAIVLRERTSLELVDLSLRFVRALRPVAYLKLMALVLLPLLGGCVALRYVLEWGWGWVWLVAFGAAVLAQPPFTVLAGRLLFADDVAVRAILAQCLRRTFAYGTLLALRAFLLVASAVTFVGPLIVWAQTAYLHEILFLEGAPLRAALGRTRRFVGGRSGSSVEMLLLCLSVLGTSVVVAEAVGLALVEYVLDIALPVESFTESGGSVFALAGLFVSVPFTSALRFLFYVNERTLRDGWDVQVRFLGIRDGVHERTR